MWRLGGMYETGMGEDGKTWTAFSWLDALVNNPTELANVLQLQ